jgi:cyclin-dependent kinase 2
MIGVCRYRLLDKVGSGVYGTVFRAKEIKSGRVVVIKQPNTSDDPKPYGLTVNMIREATLLKSLGAQKHENILNLQDWFFRHDRLYLVFDPYYCNLRDYLYDVASSGQSSIYPMQLNSYMCQLMSALEYCHRRRVIHRDLKPDNILLDECREKLVVCDFGMSRTFSAGESYTDNCVTSWYRPPEILLGDIRYGAAVDVWSAGMIMAEMINLVPVLNRAKNDFECLLFLFKHLGRPNELIWPGVTRLPNYQEAFAPWPCSPPSSLLGVDGICPEAIDLLNRMLQLCPASRITALDATMHEFFMGGGSRLHVITAPEAGDNVGISGAPIDCKPKYFNRDNTAHDVPCFALKRSRVSEDCLFCEEILGCSDVTSPKRRRTASGTGSP